MRRIQGHYGGSTWAGATRPCGLPRRLTPRSSLPPTNYQRPEPGLKLDRHEYLIRSVSSTSSGPDGDRKRAAIAARKETTNEQTEDRAWSKQD
jgi:hypothetical protein